MRSDRISSYLQFSKSIKKAIEKEYKLGVQNNLEIIKGSSNFINGNYDKLNSKI